jgi:negative regulator of sigma E activity
MNDDRLDLRALDPEHDPVCYERAIGRILARAAQPLAARRARTTPMGQITTWWRPMLALAAALVLAAIGVLAQVQPAAAVTNGSDAGVAEALGIPTVLATWIGAEETPTAAQVFSALEGAQ